MQATIDPTRWSRIADLPMPAGVGDLETGLCAVARFIYAATGKVTDQHECVPLSIRAFMIALNDAGWASEFRPQLGTLELAQQVLAANPSRETEIKRGYMLAAERWAGLGGRETGCAYASD